MAAQFLGHAESQAVHRSLCQIVTKIALHIAVSVPKGRGHDQPSPLLDHSRRGKPACKPMIAHPTVEHGLPMCKGLLPKRRLEDSVKAFVTSPGVIDEQVEPPLIAVHAIEQ